VGLAREPDTSLANGSHGFCASSRSHAGKGQQMGRGRGHPPLPRGTRGFKG